ncbi:UvrD-helicase domain-containing protein [Methanoplanus endosymbiosus]|uniref:DNA 3'-5' helicase n=1 Tax=Methanoplanus endosymbiosus TaxID=33865 RepID=A0A9E7PM58_9EURY|nr:UvrD-helicase domain-containing protein [Methanoplanus endosymbiosus]UUX91494.1 UvrD-helicase domain-containing protein [Methanoplanus endosymbiosus]
MLTDRQKDAIRHDISLCVTAGAGTGKTHVLVTRYLDLIENAGCRPSDILALTFTEKAASEMKERAEKEIFSKKGEFWDKIREDMMWAQISTFHSFCAGILREFALEAGVDPGFAILAGNESEEIISEALRVLFHDKPRTFYENEINECLNAFGLYTLDSYLRNLYNKRRIAKDFFVRLAADDDYAVSLWRDELIKEQEFVAGEFLANPDLTDAALSMLHLAEVFGGEKDKAGKYLASVKGYLEMMNSGDYEMICRGIGGIAVTKGGSRSMGSAKIMGDSKADLVKAYSVLKEFADNSPSALLSSGAESDDPEIVLTLRLLKSLGVVFDRLCHVIEKDKASRGAIDFTDMIDGVYRLFNSRPDIVAEHFRGRYSYIMVDEFQDTDPVQTAIISMLPGDSGPGCKSLFVVGDPKQSIYLFRDADVTQFKKTSDMITDDFSGCRVALDISFRSTEPVISFVNLLFNRILKDSGRAWDFDYEPVSCHRGEDLGSVELLLSAPGENVMESALSEYDMVAARIRSAVLTDQLRVYAKDESGEVVCRNADWGDIAVLMERRTNLRYLEHALDSYGIPYRIYSGFGFYSRQEILDAGSLFSFLRDPYDDIALYGLLRSPWFGFSDAELFRACGGRAGRLYDRIVTSGGAVFTEAVQLLDKWHGLAGRISVSELFRVCILDSGISAVYSGIPGGEQMLSNLDKLSGIIREREKKGFYSLHKFTHDLVKSIESGESEGEGEVYESGSGKVSVMTVHASKGLEFPVVFVPGLSESPPGDRSTVIIDEECGVGIKIPDAESGDYVNSLGLNLQKYRMKLKSGAESRRLFYVAVTRARDHLVLSGTMPKKVPETEQGCSRRIDWIFFNIFSGDNSGTASGVHEITDGDYSCTIRVISDRSEIIADKVDCKRDSVVIPDCPLCVLPDGDDSHGVGMPPGDAGSQVGNAEMDLSDDVSGSLDSPGNLGVDVRTAEVLSSTVVERYIATGSMDPPEKILSSVIAGKKNIHLSLSSGGPLRGSIIHSIMAGETDTESPDIPTELREDCREMYHKFVSSEFMQDVTDDYKELPFSMFFEGYPFRGDIDRLIRKSDGWYVLDFKTGNPSGKYSHDVQMVLYKMAAEKITGESVRTFLYYTESCMFKEVIPDVTELSARIREACKEISGKNSL